MSLRLGEVSRQCLSRRAERSYSWVPLGWPASGAPAIRTMDLGGAAVAVGRTSLRAALTKTTCAPGRGARPAVSTAPLTVAAPSDAVRSARTGGAARRSDGLAGGM